MIDFKFWRNKRNLTRTQLANMARTSVNYIYEIETSKKSPSMKMINKLANALEISIIVKDLRESEEYIESEVEKSLAWDSSNK